MSPHGSTYRPGVGCAARSMPGRRSPRTRSRSSWYGASAERITDRHRGVAQADDVHLAAHHGPDRVDRVPLVDVHRRHHPVAPEPERLEGACLLAPAHDDLRCALRIEAPDELDPDVELVGEEVGLLRIGLLAPEHHPRSE